MAPRKKNESDGGAQQVADALHEAQHQGYLGSRPENAPSFESQTVAGVTSGQNVDEAETPEGGDGGETSIT